MHDDKIVEKVKKMYLAGIPMAQISKQKGMPTVKTITAWRDRFGWDEGEKFPPTHLAPTASNAILNPFVLLSEVENYFSSLFTEKTVISIEDKDDGFGGTFKQQVCNVIHDENGQVVLEQTLKPTVAGLAIFLKISQTTLVKYKNGVYDHELPDGSLLFSEVINRAYDMIEEYNNQLVYDNKTFKGAELMLNTKHDVIRKTKSETTIVTGKKLEDYF